jgi:hypothetical protein
MRLTPFSFQCPKTVRVLIGEFQRPATIAAALEEASRITRQMQLEVFEPFVCLERAELGVCATDSEVRGCGGEADLVRG